MAPEYFDTLWSLLEKDKRAFERVRKSMNLPGYRPGKVPAPLIKRVARSLPAAQFDFLCCVLKEYFPDEKITDEAPPSLDALPDRLPGRMASYALHQMEDQFPMELIPEEDTVPAAEPAAEAVPAEEPKTEEPAAETVPAEEPEDEEPVAEETPAEKTEGKEPAEEKAVAEERKEEKLKTEGPETVHETPEPAQEKKPGRERGKKNTMRYLGYISVYSTYTNFFPCAVIHEDYSIEVMDLAERKARFPERGNINIFNPDWREDKNKVLKLLQDKRFYVFDLPDELDDNIIAGQLNLTNKRISIRQLTTQNGIFDPEKLKILPVIQINSLDDIIANKGNIHFDPDQYGFVRDMRVMLQVENTMYGPFFAYLATQTVSVPLKANNYLVDTYENIDEKYIKTITDITNFPDDDGGITFVSLGRLKPVKTDCITDRELVGEMVEIINRSGETGVSPKALIDSAFDGLNVPEEIRQRRKERLSGIFDSQESLETLASEFATMIKRVLIRAANENSPEFDEIIRKLAADPEFMMKIQRYSYIHQQIDELEQDLTDRQAELVSVEMELRTSRKKLEDEKAQALNKEITEMTEKRDALLKELDELTEKLSLARELGELRIQKGVEAQRLEDLREEKEAVQKDVDSAYETLRQQAKDPISTLTAHLVNQHIAGIIEESVEESMRKGDPEKILTDLKCAFYQQAAAKKTRVEEDELYERVSKYRPGYSKNDIINLFLCVANSFLTVFSGAPGTGKTSICMILAHALGLDSFEKQQVAMELWKEDPAQANRFAIIPVERGWTSKRDLIGYYNPLAKTYDKVNPYMYQALEITSSETGENVIPYFVLLDEANLSPMEYYWADFMAPSDRMSSRSPISISEDKVFHVSPALRFLATINNDHTTENLSPRLIDRAWIVSLPQPEDPNYTEFDDRYEPVTLQNLEELFCPDSETQMNPSANALLKDIYEFCRKNLGMTVSPRTELAIRRYCSVGQDLFESVEDVIVSTYIAVDYAVAQKILPQLQGSGAQFKEKLEKFRTLLQTNNLVKSAKIVDDIISTGDSNMMYYQFFG